MIPCDGSSYNAVDVLTGSAFLVSNPDDRVFAGGAELLAEFAWQHPLIQHHVRTGDRRALRISDFVTRRQLHRTDLYNHIYRVIGLEHQLAITLPPRANRPRELVGLALDRGRRDFSDGERDLLQHLRPHFANALERLGELTVLRAAVHELSEDTSSWLVLCTVDGTIAWATPAVSRHLGFIVGGALPTPLRRCLARQVSRSGGAALPVSAARAELVDLPGGRVRVSLSRDAGDDLHVLRLNPMDGLPGPAELTALGLSRRQAEALALLMRGHTAAQIAEQLYLSRRTVEKHLAGAYARLGARTRSEAIVRASHRATYPSAPYGSSRSM